MDKTLLKAYIRTIVEEEVKRILPELLGEAVSQIKKAQVNENSTPSKQPLDRKRLAELMDVEYDGETIRPRMRRGGVVPHVGEETSVDDFINKDWSKFKF